MNKKIVAFLTLLTTFGVIGVAVISSFGKITGTAMVKPSIAFDIIGSTNDQTYTLSNVLQGETKFSPQIKIVNNLNSSVKINFTLKVIPTSSGTDQDVSLNLVNEIKNETLVNPL